MRRTLIPHGRDARFSDRLASPAIPLVRTLLHVRRHRHVVVRIRTLASSLSARAVSASAADANTRFFRAPCDIRAAASNVNACTPSFSAHTRTVKLAWYARRVARVREKIRAELDPVVSVQPPRVQIHEYRVASTLGGCARVRPPRRRSVLAPGSGIRTDGRSRWRVATQTYGDVRRLKEGFPVGATRGRAFDSLGVVRKLGFGAPSLGRHAAVWRRFWGRFRRRGSFAAARSGSPNA